MGNGKRQENLSGHRIVSLKSIIATLPTLGPKGIEELRVRLSILSESSGHTSEDRIMYDLLVDAIRSSGSRAMPKSIAMRNKRYRSVAQGFRELQNYTDEVLSLSPYKVTKVFRSGFYTAAFELCIRYLKIRSIPVGVFTVGDALCHIDQIIEAQFPGYAESGLAHIIIGNHDHAASYKRSTGRTCRVTLLSPPRWKCGEVCGSDRVL